MGAGNGLLGFLGLIPQFKSTLGERLLNQLLASFTTSHMNTIVLEQGSFKEIRCLNVHMCMLTEASICYKPLIPDRSL